MTNRYTLLLLLSCCFAAASFAQKRTLGSNVTTSRTITGINLHQPANLLQTRTVTDTLYPGAFNDACGDTQFSYNVPDPGWGYIAGTNNFEDKEKAQRIYNEPNTAVTISETWAFFGNVSQVGNGSVRMKIYRVEDNRPGSLIAQSNGVRVEDIQVNDTVVVATPFSYPVPVTIDDPSFFLSMDFSTLYSTFDTVGLFHTEIGCGNGAEAFELWATDEWYSMPDAWLSDFGNFEINFSLIAVVAFEDPNSTDDYYQQNQLRLYPAAPNPARQRVQLRYELQEAGPVRIGIYAADGRQLRHLDMGVRFAGPHTTHVDVSDFPAGSYVYMIQTERGQAASRFLVKK